MKICCTRDVTNDDMNSPNGCLTCKISGAFNTVFASFDNASVYGCAQL